MNNKMTKKSFSFGFYVVTLVTTVWVVFFNLCSGVIIREFSATFNAFGNQLPWLTHFIISNLVYIWAVLVLLAVSQFGLMLLMYVMRSSIFIIAFFILFAVNIAFELTAIVAMYLPIFSLGSVV
jgi:type II secretory pathway component PulF